MLLTQICVRQKDLELHKKKKKKKEQDVTRSENLNILFTDMFLVLTYERSELSSAVFTVQRAYNFPVVEVRVIVVSEVEIVLVVVAVMAVAWGAGGGGGGSSRRDVCRPNT
jgi:hypothetical protein